MRHDDWLRSPQPTEELCRLYHGVGCSLCPMAAVIDRRLREMQDGTVELVDGKVAMAHALAAVHEAAYVEFEARVLRAVHEAAHVELEATRFVRIYHGKNDDPGMRLRVEYDPDGSGDFEIVDEKVLPEKVHDPDCQRRQELAHIALDYDTVDWLADTLVLLREHIRKQS